APAPRADPRPLPGARHRAPRARPAEPAQEALRLGLQAESQPVRRAAGLSGGALLDPAQPPAFSDRGAGEAGAGVRDEESERTGRAGREPGVRPAGPGARRALPPSAAAHAEAGASRARLRAAERAAPLLRAVSQAAARHPARSGELGGVVRGVEAPAV